MSCGLHSKHSLAAKNNKHYCKRSKSVIIRKANLCGQILEIVAYNYTTAHCLSLVPLRAALACTVLWDPQDYSIS